MPQEVKQRSGIATGLNAGHVRLPPPSGCHRAAKWSKSGTRKRTVGLTHCDTESHSPPAEAESLAHERSPEQEDRIRQGRREGGFRVCIAPRRRSRIKRAGRKEERTWSLTLNSLCSLAPYERRVIELLRNSKDKRARKLAKKRLGTFGRGKRKVDEMTKVIAESRRAGH